MARKTERKPSRRSPAKPRAAVASAVPLVPASRSEDRLAEISVPFRPLALASMFWRPSYLAPGTSAWVGHTAFAFWIVEAMRPESLVELGTHYGHSYFAFCQAVERLGLDAVCYAVDTWQGDQHVSAYGEEVFAQVNAYNMSHYAGFSTLVRSSFDEAVSFFDDRSIDLLHIDGTHTFEAVRHDFETWLPKMSNRGVVLLHDTNVRQKDFGVAKFFKTLAREYPSFEFSHGHGLGVVGVGHEQAPLLRELFSIGPNPQTKAAVHQIFARLGQASVDLDSLGEAKTKAAGLSERLSSAEAAHGHAVEKAALLRGQLVEKIARLESEKEEYRQSTQARIATLEAQLDDLRRQAQAAVAPQELANLRVQAEALQVTASEKSARLDALTAQLAARDAQLQELATRHTSLVTASQQREAEYSELATRHQSLATAHEDLATRHTPLVTSHDAITARVAALEAQSQEVTARQAAADEECQRLAAERDNLAAQLESLRLEHSDLVTRHQSLVTSQEELVTRHTSLATTHEDLVTCHAPLVTSHEDLSTRYHQLETAYAELTARHMALVTSGSDLSARLDALEAQRQEAVARCATSIEEQQRVLAERDQLAAELESLRSENSELVTRHQSLVTASQQREAEYSELATRHQSLTTAHEDLVTAHESLDTAHATLIARNAALEAERSELVARRQMLATNVQLLESKQSSGAKEISALRNRLDRAEDQRKEAIARADKAEKKEEELEAKIALLATAREKLVAEKEDILSRLTRSESERGLLQQEIDGRSEELVSLTKRIMELEEKEDRSGKAHAEIHASLMHLQKEHAVAVAEKVRLQVELKKRFKEIAGLTLRVSHLEEALASSRLEVTNFLDSTSWRLTKPLRALRGGAPVDQRSK